MQGGKGMIIYRPTSLDEALFLLEKDPGLKPVSGGTDLIPRLNQRLERHPALCLLGNWPEMNNIRTEEARIFIGARLTLSEIGRHPLLAPFKALRYAANHAASPQIRNQATVGGNILQENRCMYFNNQVPWSDVSRCYKWGGTQCFQYPGSRVCMALFQSDLAPVLMSYSASVRIKGAGGEYEMPIEDLYLAGGKKNLRHDELLTGVLFPEADSSHRCAYARWTLRGSFDFPLLGCAASMNVLEGKVRNCRIVFGSAGIRPRRFEAGEAAFDGQPAGSLKEIAHTLHEEASKVIMGFTDTHVDSASRKEKAGWLLEDALSSICESL